MVTTTQSLDLCGLLPRIENALFDAQDTISFERADLALSSLRASRGQPQVLRRAAVLETVLAGMSLELPSNPVFAGRTAERPRAWMLVPECGLGVSAQVRIEQDLVSQEWFDAQISDDFRESWREEQVCGGLGGIGHLSVDYSIVVGRGLEALIAEIEAACDGDAERDAYRQGMLRSCRALIAWAARWAAAAEAAALSCEDAGEAACYRRMASACRQVPARPARNLHEGLQAILLLHLGLALEGQGYSISLGLPDRVLAPFNDEVQADPQAAVQLIRAFLVGLAANSWQGRGSVTQCITLGGSKGSGSDACNAVTRAFLDAFAQTPVADPHCFFRWHLAVDQHCWQQVLTMLSAGRSMPLLVNDHEIIPHLRAVGVASADAAEYCIIGCNELGIPGRLCSSAFSAGLGFNDLGLLDACMRDETRSRDSAEAFLANLQERYHTCLSRGFEKRRAHIAGLIERLPMPLSSACCHGTVAAGADLLTGMPYDIPGCFIRGTSNAINGLAALAALIWEGVMPMTEFMERLDARDPELLAAISALPKWGNDDRRVDIWATRLCGIQQRAIVALCEDQGLPAVALCHVVRSLHHLDGYGLGNTADGRSAGEAVGDSIGAICGTSTEGPTAQLRSVLNIASRDFLGVYNHNLSLSGNHAHPDLLRALIETFFVEGGQELQINVLDAAKLRAAKNDPAAHGDLVVRIAGLNARFIELSAMEQDEIIRRAENA